jgi:hypothetical protein
MEPDGLVEAVLVVEALRVEAAPGFPGAEIRLVAVVALAVVAGFFAASEIAAFGRVAVALFAEVVERVGDVTDARAFPTSAGGLAEIDEGRGRVDVDDAREGLGAAEVAGFTAGAKEALREGAGAEAMEVRDATVGLGVVVGAVVDDRLSVDAVVAGLVTTALPDTDDRTPGAGLTDPAPNVPELMIWGMRQRLIDDKEQVQRTFFTNGVGGPPLAFAVLVLTDMGPFFVVVVGETLPTGLSASSGSRASWGGAFSSTIELLTERVPLSD